MDDIMRQCPKCGQTKDQGYLALQSPLVQVQFYFLRFKAGATVVYSSKCGFLRIIAGPIDIQANVQ